MNAIQRTELHMAETSKDASIGVVIVAFNSSDVIAGCLDSLIAQDGPTPTIVVVDNASDDTTVLAVRSWAKDRKDASGQDLLFEVDAQGLAKPRRGAQVLLLHSGVNLGFAGGVNLGLSALATLAEIAHFWVLNPDAYADPQATIAILAAAQETPVYGLMGGRVCYATPPHTIQTDGGLLNMWTGVSSDVNQGKQAATAAMPTASEIDFINGANMVASRRFYDEIGPMREDYFLYYEETDWALRRGDFPLLVASGFIAYHHAGTAIGSPTLMRGPVNQGRRKFSSASASRRTICRARARNSRAAGACAQRSAACCLRGRNFCCWTSRPTISILKARRGSRSISASIRTRW